MKLRYKILWIFAWNIIVNAFVGDISMWQNWVIYFGGLSFTLGNWDC